MDTLRGKQAFIVLLVLAFCIYRYPAAQDFTADSQPFPRMGGATSEKAVFAAFLSSLKGGTGADSAISVSHVLADSNNEAGSLAIHLRKGNGDSYLFLSEDHPDVGRGLDENGHLQAAPTWLVFLSEIIRASAAEDVDFFGYAWIVPDFHRISGTYTNFFPGLGLSVGQAFQLQPPPAKTRDHSADLEALKSIAENYEAAYGAGDAEALAEKKADRRLVEDLPHHLEQQQSASGRRRSRLSGLRGSSR